MTVKERARERLYLVGHVEVVDGVPSEPEEDVEEGDDPEGDEEGEQGEPNPTPVTPQKRAEKAEEKRRRRRVVVVVVVSSCNVAALVIVQLASWPASQLGSVDKASKYRVAQNDSLRICNRWRGNHATTPPRKLGYAVQFTQHSIKHFVLSGGSSGAPPHDAGAIHASFFNMLNAKTFSQKSYPNQQVRQVL